MRTEPRASRRSRLPLCVLLLACIPPLWANSLDRVLERGELRVLTRNTDTTYYQGPDGPSGMEFDLAFGFAQELGVTLKLVVEENIADILYSLSRPEVDFAAAGLSITPERKTLVRFTPPYQTITQQLIYRSGGNRPRNLDQLDGTLVVAVGSNHSEALRRLHTEHPDLDWHEDPQAEIDELIARLWGGEFDYTLCNSNEVALARRYYPELRVGFDLGEDQQLAWAFSRQQDPALYQAAVKYLDKLQEDGTLEQLLERYYGHLVNYDYVGTRTFFHHYHSRFEKYRSLLQQEAERHDLNWQLLAAVAYQESHWNPDAVSPTGVRGFMMLTSATAKQLGIEDRRDAEQSIHGGAQYLRHILDKIPERIQEPDRTWLALAAYNIGYGHLEDARILTENNGGNPDSWKDLKRYLPLLRKKRWYSQTRYGFARGDEATQYVENIRSYLDILLWLEEKRVPLQLARDDEAAPAQDETP